MIEIKQELLEWIYPEGSHERAAWINGDKNEADFILDSIVFCRKHNFDIYSREALTYSCGAVYLALIYGNNSQWEWGDNCELKEREAYLKAFEQAYYYKFGKIPI